MPRKKQRIPRRRSKPCHPLSNFQIPPTHKRKKWAGESMVGAMKEVKKGKFSLTELHKFMGFLVAPLKIE